jgi:coenzyme PQQ synthesis protein D (PqqD)
MAKDDVNDHDGGGIDGGEVAPPGTPRLRVDEVVWREVGDDLVVLELSTSTYLTLNGSAKQLWISLAEGGTVPGLVERLTELYGISDEQASSDTEAFLAALAERKLLAFD